MTGSLDGAHVLTKLPAQDLDRARLFYRDQLGLEPIEERDGGLRYVCDTTEFHLSSRLAWRQELRPKSDSKSTTSSEPSADLRSRGVHFEPFDSVGYDIYAAPVIPARHRTVAG
jgi:catechol 2,3-dioxygenase-like lactoylglutathione lyase family enzyme